MGFGLEEFSIRSFALIFSVGLIVRFHLTSFYVFNINIGMICMVNIINKSESLLVIAPPFSFVQNKNNGLVVFD